MMTRERKAPPGAKQFPRVPARSGDGCSAETYRIDAGALAGLNLTICLAPSKGDGRVRISANVLHLTQSGYMTAGEMQRLRDQIDQALEGLG